jgi:hypothetical protein
MLRAAVIFFFVILVVATLAWLTLVPPEPCETPNADIGAAVLAEEEGDQDALINTAIFRRARCIPPEEMAPAEEPEPAPSGE